MSLVRFEAVRKRFGERQVLDGLSFAIERGEVYGLLGPNGSGKSTAIHILCGLLDADDGSVSVGGAPRSAATVRRLGTCPQEIALYRDLTPAENLDFFGRLHGLPADTRRRRVDELLGLLRLEPYATTRVAQLSGGWQQRVNMAVALVHSPDLLILDEPTSAVDVEARHELWQLIDGLRQGGMTVLMTTHQLDEAQRLCTRIGIVDRGRITCEGSVAQLLARVPGQAVALVQAADDEAVKSRARARGWPLRSYAGTLACLLPQPLALREVIEVFDGIDVSSVALQEVRLEHAYLEVMRLNQAQPASTASITE